MPKSHSDLAIEAATKFLRDKFTLSAEDEVQLSDVVTYRRESGVRAFWADFAVYKLNGSGELNLYQTGAAFGFERLNKTWECTRYVVLP